MRGSRTLQSVVFGGLLASLWLACHPYLGIVGDARFYNVQFLHRLNPAAFNDDLYFKFGSQDEFTVFTPLIAPVIELLGLNAGNIVLNLVFQGFWLIGLWFTVCGLSAKLPARVFAVAAVTLFPGGIGPFHYAEQFLTPRILAEALGLWAVGFMLRDQPLRAAAILAVSAFIHPLMTIPCIGLLFLRLAGSRKWIIVAAAAISAGVAALAMFGVGGFARLAERYDPAWFSVVNIRDKFCLVGNWDLSEWLPVCNTLAIAAAGIVWGGREMRRLLAALVALLLGSVAVTWVGADLLHLVLITQLQLWRAVWLLSAVANACFGIIVFCCFTAPASGRNGRLLLLAAVFSATSKFLAGMALLVSPAVMAAILVWMAHASLRSGPVRQIKLLDLTLTSLLVLTGVFGAAASFHSFDAAPVLLGQTIGALLLSTVCGGVLTAIVLKWRPATSGRGWNSAVAALTVALVLVALFRWDQRSPWRKYVETAAGTPSTPASSFPTDAEIYWEGDVALPWFTLGRANYISCDQGAGALFKRGTAIEYARRYAAFQILGSVDFWKQDECPGAADFGASMSLGIRDLEAICRSEHHLTAIVLTRPVRDDNGVVWVPPVPYLEWLSIKKKLTEFQANAFHVYMCDSLR